MRGELIREESLIRHSLMRDKMHDITLLLTISQLYIILNQYVFYGNLTIFRMKADIGFPI